MSKKITAAVLVIIMILSFTGCTAEKEFADDGKVHEYNLSDITENKKEGFFVLNENNTLTPFRNYVEGYQGELNSEDGTIPSRYLWWTDRNSEITDLIPKINSSNKIVAIYNKNSNLPESLNLEKYEDKGYTLGCHIYKDEFDNLCITARDALSDSYMYQQLSWADEDYKIQEINKSDKLPVSNVDNNLCMILGLQKDAKYLISFYKGTTYNVIETYADTRCLQAERLIALDNPYETTKEGYFILSLPDNLEGGYYYLSGAGLFKYEK